MDWLTPFEVTSNQPMSGFVSWRTGGVAQYFYTPKNIEELADFLSQKHQYQPELAIYFLGLGSNLLVSSNDFSGVMIYTKHLNQLSQTSDSIVAQAGVSLAKLSRFSQKNNNFGAEFLSTIPGSVGGGLAMNAGCFEAEIWQWVSKVQTINIQGKINTRTKDDFIIGYRSVVAKNLDEYFLTGEFVFAKTPIGDNIKDLLLKRQQSQPIGLASCGSVFTNPVGHYAGNLIEQVNLKGFCVGGACVSNKHANFIINQNNASPEDIINLIQHIKTTVKQQLNINLETEVKII